MTTELEKRDEVFIRRTGSRVCATFSNGQFWIGEDAKDDARLLERAGVTSDQLPCHATLPLIDRAITHLVHGP